MIKFRPMKAVVQTKLGKSPDHEFDRELLAVVIPKLHEWAHKEAALSISFESPRGSFKSGENKTVGIFEEIMHSSPSIYIAGASESRFLCTRGCRNYFVKLRF